MKVIPILTVMVTLIAGCSKPQKVEVTTNTPVVVQQAINLNTNDAVVLPPTDFERTEVWFDSKYGRYHPYVVHSSKVVWVNEQEICVHVGATYSGFEHDPINQPKNYKWIDRTIFVVNHPKKDELTTSDTLPKCRCVFLKNVTRQLANGGVGTFAVYYYVGE